MDALQNRKHSNINYWLAVAGLLTVAFFVPHQYSTLIFLGAVFALLWEISDRLREQYYLHKSVCDALGEAVKLLDQIESNTEKASEYLYAQTPEYRAHVAEIERLRP